MSRRIGLVGCVKSKLPYPAPARDLYTSSLFRGRRAYVERTCDGWFVLSAKHGLVEPDRMVEPYDETLKDADRAHRRRWSAAVLSSLGEALGNVQGIVFEAHAGHNYLDYGLAHGLMARGAKVERPTEHLGLGRQLAFYGEATR
jgi:hypothetical protein